MTHSTKLVRDVPPSCGQTQRNPTRNLGAIFAFTAVVALSAGCGDEVAGAASDGGAPLADAAEGQADEQGLAESEGNEQGTDEETGQEPDIEPWGDEDSGEFSEPDTRALPVEPQEIAVGILDTQVPGPDGLTLPVTVWYPSLADTTGKAAVDYLGIHPSGGFAGLPVAEGTHPILLFSHGFGALRVQSFTFCEAWARAGFVVAAPDHVGNTAFDGAASPSAVTGEVLASIGVRRPLDLGAVYAELEKWHVKEGHPLAGALDLTRVALSGHSFGGFTVIAASGAEADPGYAAALCASGEMQSLFCPILEEFPAELTQLAPTNMPTPLASIPMAPGGWVVFGPEGLKQSDTPALFLAGDADNITPLHSEVQRFYDDWQGAKMLGVLAGGNHYTFSDLCNVPLLVASSPFLAAQCAPGMYLDLAVGHDIVLALSELWLEAWVMGSVEAAAALDAPGSLESGWPGVLSVQSNQGR